MLACKAFTTAFAGASIFFGTDTRKKHLDKFQRRAYTRATDLRSPHGPDPPRRYGDEDVRHAQEVKDGHSQGRALASHSDF